MSKSLKDLIASDIDLVFMQLEDFGEVHKIEGKSITIIIDNDTLVTMKNGNILGVAEPGAFSPSRSSVLAKIRVSDSWAENLGITQIALHHTRMV